MTQFFDDQLDSGLDSWILISCAELFRFLYFFFTV